MTPAGADDLHAFVLELGRQLSLAGTAVSETQERLTRVVASSGGRDARVIVLPTALMIAFGRAGWATIESTPQLAGTMRLDQISALYEVVHEAERGAVEPEDGLRRLRAISEMPPRHGAVVTVLAYAATTLALCLVLEPSARDAAISAVFGALVGTILLVTRDRPALTALVPVQSATLIFALPAFWLLVPGALGLIGVTEVVGNPADAGIEDLVKPLGSIIAIALGVLCGVSVFRGLAAAPSRLRRR